MADLGLQSEYAGDGIESEYAGDGIAHLFSERNFGNGMSSFFVASASSKLSSMSNATTPVNLMYVSKVTSIRNDDPEARVLTVFNCTVFNPKIEGVVECDSADCKMAKVRRTQKALSFPLAPPVHGYPHPASPAAIDICMLGAENPFSDESLVHSRIDGAGDWSGISKGVFSQGLTTRLHTLWQVSLAPSGVRLGSSANLTSQLVPSENTAATITKTSLQYIANRIYVGLLLAVSLTLQICAVAGFAFTLKAKAPDILGYISTMTRDNPYTDVPVGRNTLSGLERARYLFDLKIRLVDIMPRHEFGHIAFRSIGDSSSKEKDQTSDCGKPDRKRLYL
ncbi:MAG: hypothetical protein Q9221_002150 [Calogaya cf. arnoldii]